MKKEKMRELLKETSSMTDPELYPSISAYLNALLVGIETASAHGIATKLMELDWPEALPQFLIDCITELLESEIADGNAEAMNDLGSHYYCGRRGFRQSFPDAMRLYDLAAKNGSWQAQENLGYCYYYGKDGKKDYEKAFHYFALGAFDGHLISLYKIGDMYRNGYYVEKNEIEAFHIYRRCLETMTDEAANEAAGPVYLRYGDMVLNGLGTEIDPETALWAYHNAEQYLGNMVRHGDSMYAASLQKAIEGQQKAREALAKIAPKNDWLIDE